MVDIVDIATNDILQVQAERIRRLHQKVLSQKKVSSHFCIECGEPIPEERRRSVPGCRLCVDCQTKKRKVKK